MTAKRRIDYVVQSLAWLAVVLAALTIVLPAQLPAQDASSHLLAAQVHLHPERFVGLYEPRLALTGQSIVTFSVGLGRFVGPVWGAKVAMLLGLALQVGALRHLARQSEASLPAATAGGAMLAVGWTYAMGFFSFGLAVAMASAGWAVWFGPFRSMRRDALAAALFVAAAWSHSIACGIVLAHVAAHEVFAKRISLRDLGRWWVFVPPGLYAVAVSWLSLSTHSEIGAVEHTLAYWLPWPERLWALVACGFTSYSRVAASASLAVLLTVFQVLVSRRRETREQVAASWVALAWTIAFLLMPFHGLGWHFAGPRVLVAASGLSVAMLFPSRRSVNALLLALVAVLSFVHGLPTAVHEGERIANSASLFGDSPVGRTFVVTFNPDAESPFAPWARPNLATGRYATFAGGADPGALAFDSPTHAIRFVRPMSELFPHTNEMLVNYDESCPADVDCAALSRARADDVATSAVAWDTVTLVEPPLEFVEQLIARGFVPQAPAVLRPRSSTVTLHVQIPQAAEGLPLVFAASWPQSAGRFRGGRIAAADSRPPELSIEFAPMPAGPTEFVACGEVDGDNACGPADIVVFGPQSVVVQPGVTSQIGP